LNTVFGGEGKKEFKYFLMVTQGEMPSREHYKFVELFDLFLFAVVDRQINKFFADSILQKMFHNMAVAAY
jgi:hypothetical protein